MGMKVGINGFGRIGRLVLRLGMERPDIEFVGINSHSQTPDYMAYLLKYDSVHGRYQGEVSWDGDDLIVNGPPDPRVPLRGTPRDSLVLCGR